MDHYNTINDALVNLFREVMDLEENAIITSEFSNLTNNEMHVIDSVGIGEPKNMSSIAKKLSVTVGTLTTAMNALVRKGYVERRRSESDRRIVEIVLTEKGRKAYEHHDEFHREMIQALGEELSKEEMDVLVRTLRQLSQFFQTFQTEQQTRKM